MLTHCASRRYSFNAKYSMGQFDGPVIFYLLETLTTGQFAGQLSKIFSNSWGQFAIGPVAKPQ
jgi:hypothetical protein